MTSGSRRLLQVCLFVTGGSSLVLEVAWSKSLSLSLGNTHHAIATVIASFMAGLFLGSLLAVRFLSRVERVPRAYARVELGVGIYSALTPLIFLILPAVLAPLYQLPPSVFGVLRFLIVFAILLPPSAGMGATLPLLTAALSRSLAEEGGPRDPGSIGGRLYGLNTLGAFLGTLAGGFLLLPNLGIHVTTWVGSAGSLGVGLLVLLLFSKVQLSRIETEIPARKPAAEGALLILPLYAISGCLAMVYEVTWTRALTPLTGASVYSFTLILATILMGIGLGSLCLSTRHAANIDPGRGFVVGQFILAVGAFLSAWGLGLFPNLLLGAAARAEFRAGSFFVWQAILLAFIILLPGILLGSLFPFAARLLQRIQQEAGAEVGRVYAWNTAGSIVGSLAAGFFLVQTLGTERTLILACIGSVSLGLAALIFTPGRRFRPMAAGAGILLAFLFPFLIPQWDLYLMTSGLTQILRNLRQQGTEAARSSLMPLARTPDSRVLSHREGSSSTVTVVKEWLDIWLRVDGKTDASTSDRDMLTQVLLGHLPFFFAQNTDRACVIGFGSGVTSHAVLTHPVKLLDNIEIEKEVIEASRFFEQVNHKPLEDPRSRLFLEDARTSLLYRPQSYDVIISEPSNPWIAGVNNLFTTEFYDLVRKRLAPGGVFCQWVQAYEMSKESVFTLVDTIGASFPHVHLFASHLKSDMLLIASAEPIQLAPGAVDFFPERPQVAEDLARIDVNSLADLAIFYTTPILAPSAETVLNTDDNSLIQYRTPLELIEGREPAALPFEAAGGDMLRIFFGHTTEVEALIEVARASDRRNALPTVEGVVSHLEQQGYLMEAQEVRTLAEKMKERLTREGTSRQNVMLADSRLAMGDVAGALSAVADAEAAGLAGGDDLARAGFIYFNLGRYEKAAELFSLAIEEPHPQLYYQSLVARGCSLYRLGRKEEGRASIQAAKALDPLIPLSYFLFGLALFDSGEREAAFEELRRGLEVAPDDPRILEMMDTLATVPTPNPSPVPPPAEESTPQTDDESSAPSG